MVPLLARSYLLYGEWLFAPLGMTVGLVAFTSRQSSD
jgi:hypothetical protein